MSRDLDDPRHLNVPAFAAAAGEIGGHTPLAAFTRLAEEFALPDDDGVAGNVEWRALGRRLEPAGGAEHWLDLQANGVAPLRCQRCLGRVLTPLVVARSFRFVGDEHTAEALDEQLEDDVLVESRSFDLLTLIEDELLLALPLVPRHDACPAGVEAALMEQVALERDNPFAVLESLRKPQGQR